MSLSDDLEVTGVPFLVVDEVVKVYEPPRGIQRLLVTTAASEPITALDGVSFAASPGEIVGVVGPNGAGKSTLIRLIAGLLSATSGQITIDGIEQRDGEWRVKHEVGLMLTDERALYWRLTGRQNLEFFGVMAGLTREAARARADELLDQGDLAHRDRKVFGYSSGMRVQLSLARALVADPKLLVLDEPSRSLDPVASEVLMDRLRALAQDGRTILLSSHRLDEVAEICDRVLVIVEGTSRYWGPTLGLTRGQDGPAASLRQLLREVEQ